jgi:predicted DNA-binding transcriptional regulator AlpA
MQKIILSTKEAALALNISEGRLKQSRRTGRLAPGIPAPPFVRLGVKSVGYVATDIERYAASLPKVGEPKGRWRK